MNISRLYLLFSLLIAKNIFNFLLNEEFQKKKFQDLVPRSIANGYDESTKKILVYECVDRWNESLM